jgi:hypothetical protein
LGKARRKSVYPWNVQSPKCRRIREIPTQKTISNLLLKNGASKIKFHPFELTLDLNRKLDDPLRSWTETLADGSRQIVNGTCLKQPQYILEFDV